MKILGTGKLGNFIIELIIQSYTTLHICIYAYMHMAQFIPLNYSAKLEH
jgi:hypothetical protein